MIVGRFVYDEANLGRFVYDKANPTVNNWLIRYIYKLNTAAKKSRYLSFLDTVNRGRELICHADMLITDNARGYQL